MKLSLLKNIFEDMQILKDSNFESLGMITDVTSDKSQKLVFLGDAKYISDLRAESGVTAVICKHEDVDAVLKRTPNIGILACKKPKEMFFQIHNYLLENTVFYGEKCANVISPNANIHASAIIGKYNVVIGEGSIIGANSVIHENTTIGKNVVVMPNVIIGGDGFQYVKTTSDFRKQVLKVKSAGKVIIEDNVEILSGTCIERGVFNNATVIGKDTKIDHLVLIGHDSKIGERCLIVGSAMVSGRVTIGDDAWIGPNSTLANGISIGKNAKVTMGSVVTQSVKEETSVSGNFAIEHTKFIKFVKEIR